MSLPAVEHFYEDGGRYQCSIAGACICYHTMPPCYGTETMAKVAQEVYAILYTYNVFMELKVDLYMAYKSKDYIASPLLSGA